MPHDSVARQRVRSEDERVYGAVVGVHDLKRVGGSVAQRLLKLPSVEIDELGTHILRRKPAGSPTLVDREPIAAAEQPIKAVCAPSSPHAAKAQHTGERRLRHEDPLLNFGLLVSSPPSQGLDRAPRDLQSARVQKSEGWSPPNAVQPLERRCQLVVAVTIYHLPAVVLRARCPDVRSERSRGFRAPPQERGTSLDPPPGAGSYRRGATGRQRVAQPGRRPWHNSLQSTRNIRNLSRLQLGLQPRVDPRQSRELI